ncbi:stalk domain-containing protein [Agathobaculum ammoniilyticum]|uniref:Stalk domain-containing protein n=1 Tax=Agathobaculum ammoniilyticum TaxID=2981778 RepID=A0ABT2U6B4_9FIRM|nr:CAP domain-containing protein [Agathobaculum ammoniilyticum]MCU6790158.1 stalk domain-containing protein [Agathobaculum ammoniilyticum]
MKKSLPFLCYTAAILINSIIPAYAANIVTAIPTREKGQAVYVDDTRVYPTGYNIAGNNYFKLRDIGTLVGFDVEWNGETQTVEISTERTALSTAGIKDEAVSGASAKVTDQKITVDGVQVNMTAYQISGNNYMKLRDIGKQIDFGVSYDAATESVRIDTDAPYTESTTPASGSAITKWNKTMSEFNQAMIDCNWRPGKYLETAKKYAPVITGKADGTVEDVIAALDAMKGAPVDAVSFEDDRTVNHFWADELRKALGQEVTSGGESTDGNAGNSSSSATVTDEMLRTWELQMVDRINEERRKVGVAELEIDEDLMWSSGFWAEHLTTDFRHAEYGEIKELADVQGVPVRDDIEDIINGENITGAGRLTGIGYDPMTLAMNNFMNSEGHRNTILDSDWTRVGVGFAVSDEGIIWCCQHFGR